MTVNEYRGPRTVERSGRGMGSWIWVAPGAAEPPPGTHAGAKLPDGNEIRDPEVELAAAPTQAPSNDRAPDPRNDSDRSNSADVDRTSFKLKVLGPVEVEPSLQPPKRSVVLELACYLALHRQHPVTTEELQIALSGDNDDGPETSAKSIRTYMSELRRWIGPDHVPSARGSGYRLAETVSSDWEEFYSLARQRSDDPWEQIGFLSEALNLVRGRPFAGTDYKWVDAELLISEMEVAIADVARQVGAFGTAQGIPGYVWFAGRRGVLACPYDIGLWEMALEGAAGYDPEELERTWRDARVSLGDEATALDAVAQRLGLS